MNLNLSTGMTVAGQQVTVTASGLAPVAPVEIVVFSTPRVLGSATADGSGSLSTAVTLPGDLEPGSHTVVARSIGPDGSPVQSMGAFSLDGSGVVTAVAPAGQVTGIEPNGHEIQQALRYGLPVYNAANHPVTTAAVATTAAVFVGLMGAAGLATSGAGMLRGSAPAGDGGSSGGRRSRGKLASVVTKKLKKLGDDQQKAGDASRTWRWPFTAQTDAFAVWLVARTQRFSALLPRSFVDGSWARAMFGSSAMLLWLAGVALGIAFLVGSDGRPAPAGIAIVAIIVGLSILDSAAGLWAWVTIVTGSLVTGNIRNFDDLRLVLGLGVLFISIPLLAHAIRPLRRKPATDAVGRFDRVADYVMPPVFLALAAGSMVKALNGLSGLEVIDKADIIVVQLTVGVVFLVRLGFEDIASHLYPERFEAVQPPKLGSPSRPIQLSSIAIRAFVIVLIAAPFFGLVWSTWLAAVLLSIPLVLKVWEDDLPNSVTLNRWYPRGVFRFAMMLVIGIYLAAWLLGSDPDDDAVRSTFILLLLPALVASLIELIAREGADWDSTWLKRLAGFPVWAFAALVCLGVITLVP